MIFRIVGANYQSQPELNGVAPNCQIISVKIGDTRLGTMETTHSLARALMYVATTGADLINLSYGEPAMITGSGRLVELINQLVEEKVCFLVFLTLLLTDVVPQGIIFVSSAGNDGPALSTIGAPAATTDAIVAVGAYVSPALMDAAHSLVDKLPELPYTWTSRGPALDHTLGVTVAAPGGAIAPVPTWALQRSTLMEGTSMASPNCCGSIALLLSALKAQGKQYSPIRIKRALQNTARPVRGNDPFAYGAGLIQIEKAYDRLMEHIDLRDEDVLLTATLPQLRKAKGIYLREAPNNDRVSQLRIEVCIRSFVWGIVLTST